MRKSKRFRYTAKHHSLSILVGRRPTESFYNLYSLRLSFIATIRLVNRFKRGLR